MTATLPYLIARAKSDMGKSPKLGLIKSLTSVSDIFELENYLSNTSYAEVVSQARPSVDILKFERELRKTFADRLLSFRTGASQRIGEILDAVILKVESENLKLIFRSIISNEVDSDILNYIVPVSKYGVKHYERMLFTPNPLLAADLITQRQLRKAIKSALSYKGEFEEELFQLTTSLEHAVYEYSVKIIPTVKTMIDYQNMLTIIRAKSLNIDPEKWIISKYGVIAKNVDRIKQMNSARDIIIWSLSRLAFAKELRPALDAPDETLVPTLEHMLEVAYNKRNRVIFNIKSNTPDAIWSYFVLKEAQVKDIARLVLGVVTKSDPELIQGSFGYYI